MMGIVLQVVFVNDFVVCIFVFDVGVVVCCCVLENQFFGWVELKVVLLVGYVVEVEYNVVCLFQFVDG